MKSMKSWLLTGILTLFATGSLWAADTSVPPLVNYQGLLTDDKGAPIADGLKKLEFNIYDAPLAGNKLWGPQVFDNVPIVNGRFNVILGPVDSNTPPRSVVDAFGSSERYLGFKVGPVGVDWSKVAEISPRQQVLSAPFALQAKVAQTVKGNELLVTERQGKQHGVVQVDYLKVLPEKAGTPEGGQIELLAGNGSKPIFLDYYGDSFRIHNNEIELFKVSDKEIYFNNKKPATLFKSEYYVSISGELAFEYTIPLGSHSFCALGAMMRDGGNASMCEVLFDNDTGIWNLKWYKRAHKDGIGCRVNCF